MDNKTAMLEQMKQLFTENKELFLEMMKGTGCSPCEDVAFGADEDVWEPNEEWIQMIYDGIDQDIPEPDPTSPYA